MNYITTYSGVHIHPLQPTQKNILIEDIAHALSLLCRGNGHVLYFYSVAQHCINCALEAKARGYSKRVQQLCLLHDASEAYIADITRPLKQHLPNYLEIEAQMQHTIYNKYIQPLASSEELKLMKEIDDEVLIAEFEVIMKENHFTNSSTIYANLILEEQKPSEMEKKYLAIFHEYE